MFFFPFCLNFRGRFWVSGFIKLGIFKRVFCRSLFFGLAFFRSALIGRVGLYSDFVALGDMRIYRLSWPEYQITWYEKMEQEGVWSDPVVDPPFNADERAKIGDLKTKLDTILTEALDKVILGDMALDDYDGVIERLKTEGGTELEKIYNDAQTRFEKM